ncbi:carboxypeptidase-like regulatory domain-containing protein [uncultured Aquimarina sp.]|uniref:carboxypeptidase-like regulatory domain-containing protein n=1 Tax=uncultured Aquimarina sp. TaxID=575652 RepID=UPI002619230A|nr:carboxypeptidase-like regulatory domain-containing protein [uncultured Aquimarina sp.]
MKKRSILFFAFSLSLLISCSSDDNTVLIPSADIIGTVELYDDDQNIVDNTNMTVSIEGTSPLITATTDLNGNYSLKNVPFDTYTLVYEKEGFGTYKRFDIEHNDTGEFTLIPEQLKLGQISNSVITESTAVINGNFIVLTVTRPDTENLLVKRMRIFYHKSEDVSNEIYTEFSPIIGTTGNPANLTFSIAFFTSLGFESGETLWFKVYGDNFYTNSYQDPDLGITVFPNVNPITTDAISIVLP